MKEKIKQLQFISSENLHVSCRFYFCTHCNKILDTAGFCDIDKFFFDHTIKDNCVNTVVKTFDCCAQFAGWYFSKNVKFCIKDVRAAGSDKIFKHFSKGLFLISSCRCSCCCNRSSHDGSLRKWCCCCSYRSLCRSHWPHFSSSIIRRRGATLHHWASLLLIAIVTIGWTVSSFRLDLLWAHFGAKCFENFLLSQFFYFFSIGCFGNKINVCNSNKFLDNKVSTSVTIDKCNNSFTSAKINHCWRHRSSVECDGVFNTIFQKIDHICAPFNNNNFIRFFKCWAARKFFRTILLNFHNTHRLCNFICTFLC